MHLLEGLITEQHFTVILGISNKTVLYLSHLAAVIYTVSVLATVVTQEDGTCGKKS